MKKKRIVTFIALIAITGTIAGCETIDKYRTTLISTGIGCTIGLGLGAIADEMSRAEDNRDRRRIENRAFGIFRERKQHNQGKMVGLGVGCLAGLGVGLYLDLMHEDMEDQFADRGITLEKVEDRNGETEELIVKMDGDINFALNSADLQGVARNNVDTLAEALELYPETGVRIWGHTDGTGPLAFNQRLSQQRAESVQRSLNISSRRVMETRGWANQRPLPGTNPDSNVPTNRRVEVRIVPQS